VIDIHHIRGTTDGRSITVGGVVVAAVEFIQNQRGAVSANVLDARQLVIGHKMSGRIAGVGRQQHRRATGDLLGDFVGVDMVVVFLGEGDGDRCDLPGSAPPCVHGV